MAENGGRNEDDVESMWCLFKECIMKATEDVYGKTVKRGGENSGWMQCNEEVNKAEVDKGWKEKSRSFCREQETVLKGSGKVEE